MAEYIDDEAVEAIEGLFDRKFSDDEIKRADDFFGKVFSQPNVNSGFLKDMTLADFMVANPFVTSLVLGTTIAGYEGMSEDGAISSASAISCGITSIMQQLSFKDADVFSVIYNAVVIGYALGVHCCNGGYLTTEDRIAISKTVNDGLEKGEKIVNFAKDLYE